MRDHLRTRDAIEHDAQLDITVRVVDRAEGSPRRSAALTVADVQGAQLACTVWEGWPGTADWAVDHWYRLRQARGQVWADDPELHVTAATTVQPLGSDIAARRAMVLVIPDAHVGKQQGGYEANTWPVDTAAGFEAAVEVALAREVDAVVQLGDLVHNDATRGITVEDRAVVTGAVDALAAGGIPFHYILGNHEREAGGALLVGHDGAHRLGVSPTMVGATVELYGLDHTDAVPEPLPLVAAPAAAVRVLCLHQSVAPLSRKAAPDVDARALLGGTDVRLDLLITGETHAHATAAVGGTHLVSAGATAPLKRGVEPSVELLQVGYGTVVPERIMLGDAQE